ncbi:MAG TPA: mycothiol synthase [Actinocrinis sp.]|nr:mycothiol synthase [Actinocrinis sp.]
MAHNEYSSARYRDELPPADRTAARDLIRAAAEADRIGPVSEDAHLALAHGRPGADFLVARTGAGDLAGYAYAGPPAEAGSRTAELVVAPVERHRGLGARLAAELTAAAAEQPDRPLEFWAHGDHPAARKLAAGLGYQAVRELRLMGLSVGSAARPAPTLPEGAQVRTFRPGADEQAWLALNARAFSHHPEQGSWTAAELAERIAEPWFDPAGFFLLVADGRLAGFHWTKVHPAGEYGPEPVGEVYVVGVDPDAQGHGYGRLLTTIGVNHLADGGLGRIVLYVDADNTPAVQLYAALGFQLESSDIMYAKPFG